MSTLHTVNKSPFERNALCTCFGHITAGDAVLMIEDGVIGARKGATTAAMVQAALQKGKVYALASDLAARGIKPGDVIDGIQLVDYGGFVDLVTQHGRTVSWL
jgi:tRNA 2-thiouridine synthesizing protein B